MNNKIFCLASAKGGSGKTILGASFAAFLSDLGKKVLIVDLDAATYGLTLLYLNEVNSYRIDTAANKIGYSPLGIFDKGQVEWNTDLVQLPNGVSLKPATFTFSIKDSYTDIEFKNLLQSFLRKVEDQFDYILLDAQAGSGSYSRIAIQKDISHEVIIVSEYDPLSEAGIERLKALFRDDLIYSRTWVLLNKLLPEFVTTFSEFFEISKLLTPIPWDADVVRAYSRRTLPLDLTHGNQFTLSVMQTLKKLLGPDLASEIELWAESRASSIREPLEDQYRDAELELKGLFEQKAYFDNKRFIYKAAPVIAITLSIILMGINVLDLKLPYSILISILGAMIVVTVLYVYSMGAGFSVGQTVEEARFSRQLSIVDDKLKKLELLRKADLETLVKEGPKQN